MLILSKSLHHFYFRRAAFAINLRHSIFTISNYITFIFISLLISLSISTHTYGYERVWIMFTDKGVIEQQLTEKLDSLRSGWSQNSLQRRSKAGLSLSLEDLPINPIYITAVTNAGAEIVCRSKWMNAVSVAASQDVISQIEKLVFVRAAHPVASFQSSSKSLDEISSIAGEEIDVIYRDFVNNVIPLGDYGQSYIQAAHAGVIEAHRRGYTGTGVLLGMLDTGFQLDHRAFAGLKLVAQYDFINGDSDPSYDSRTDKRGQANHGTACLSVIVGKDPGWLVGIAPGVSVVLAKTEQTNSEKRIEEDYWVEGIEWLEWLGVDVVSSSLSYRKWYTKSDFNGITPFITRAAERACELGVIICNSAGNAGPKDITIGAPADALSVLAIAAVDSNRQITRFSSRGPTADGRIKPDIAALGRKVVCVKPMTWKEYSRWNGTSLSCPIVAGVACLVIEAHPDWSPDRVREALRFSADRSFRPDYQYGYGIVNAADAIDYPCIAGRIISRKNFKGVEGLLVRLYNESFEKKRTTGENGLYKFVNVPDDNWYRMEIYDGESVLYSTLFRDVPPSIYLDISLDLNH